MPHSVLSQPFHRPERGSSPGTTRVVQGGQPRIGTRDGLKATAKWYREAGWL